MNSEEITQSKPHLRDTLILYEKVREFTATALNFSKNFHFEDAVFSTALIDPLFEAFSSLFDMPEENLSPLKEAMKLSRIDLSRLPLAEMPAFSLPYHEEELGQILFLISRPYFIKLREEKNLDEALWEKGRCPLCHAKPSLASITPEGKRLLHCSFCGTTGHYKRLGCPLCLSDDSSRINIITLEGERGFRADACNGCRSYLKTITGSVPEGSGPDLADLLSMPFDIIAQGKGYHRSSRNPIGLCGMV